MKTKVKHRVGTNSRRHFLKQMTCGLAAATPLMVFDFSRADAKTVPPEADLLLIRNGHVADTEGCSKQDILIRGETIVGVGRDLLQGDMAAGQCVQVIDACGLHILPGGIDPHVHLSPPFADDFSSGSRAAVAGGITTVGQIAFPEPAESLPDRVRRYRDRVSSTSMVDAMLHPVIGNPVEAEQLAALADAGHTSIKIFMMSEYFDTHLAAYKALLKEAGRLGMLVMLHCENAGVISAAQSKLKQQGRDSLAYYPESRPVEAEVLATRQAVSLCEATGCPIYIVHLSSARALAICEEAQARGLPVYVETRPLYLHLTAEKYRQPDGGLYTGMPPLRSDEDREALWRGLATGSIHTLGSDHAPWTRAQKLDPQQDIVQVHAGVNNLQVMLPMLYSEGVVKGKLSLARFVAVTSTQPAKLFGLYPRKGCIRAGADADLVLWDFTKQRIVDGAKDYSRAGFSVYDGWSVTGWPRMTIRRGDMVFDQQQVLAKSGSGQLLLRNR